MLWVHIHWGILLTVYATVYMNGFKCKVTGDVGTQPLGKPAVPRRYVMHNTMTYVHALTDAL